MFPLEVLLFNESHLIAQPLRSQQEHGKVPWAG